MSRDGRIAILMDRHRRDVKCGLCLPLDLVVIEDRPRTRRDLGDGIRERDVGGPPDVRLDHGRLAARSHDDQVPRMGDDRQIPRGRREQEVNRLPEDRALRHLDVCAILEERGVQGDERVVLESRVSGEMLLEGFGLRPEDFRERCDADAFRERPQVREPRSVPTVHEDELTGIQHPELEGLQVLGDHAVGPAENRELDRGANHGGGVRGLPSLGRTGGNARCGLRITLIPLATTRNASMSSPESVSSRTQSFGSRTAIWKTSFFFFSPPEKPSLRPRFMNVSSSPSSFALSCTRVTKSIASISSTPRYFRIAFNAAFRKYALLTPGISTGYWNAMKTPSRARSSGFIARRSLPSNRARPPVTSYVRRPARTCASVVFPLPFGPMTAWTSPALIERSIPFRISLPVTFTCRSLISSIVVPSVARGALTRPCPRGSGSRRSASGPPRRTPSGASGRPACRIRSRSCSWRLPA